MRRHVIWGLLAVVVFVFLACGGLAVPLDFAFALALGWVMYLGRVLPQVRVDRDGLATAVVCLAFLLVSTHLFLGWFYGQIQAGTNPGDPHSRRWRPRWTIALVGMVVLMFVAGISAAGIVHQIGWLLNSREPLVDGAGGARQAARRAQSVNNLKQIGLGLNNYHEDQATFPPGGTFDTSGRPLHSWQAMLLPDIEQQELYNRINFAIPWDDPRNRPPFRTVVYTYQNPGIRPTSEADAIGYAVSHYAGNARLLGGDVPRSLGEVQDGASTTILAGEVPGRFKPWGDPTNWRDPALGINRSPEGFGGPYPSGANLLMVDGSVRFVKDSIDLLVLKALSTLAGGEAIGPDPD